MVPHLTTALTGPLFELERCFLDKATEIERWLRGQWNEHTPPFYASVDLRNAGFKLAPVDTNLFPGGFNNLNPNFLPLCVQAAMSAIEKIRPDARDLLLVPENHTRNQFYLMNVARLANILRHTGLNVRIGSLLPEITAPTALDLPDGQQLVLEPLKRIGTDGRRLGLDGFDPCAVLLNNDLSAGVPPLLQGLDEQVLLPPLQAGWATRRKSRHFAADRKVAEGLAADIGVDTWRINHEFGVYCDINCLERSGNGCLATLRSYEDALHFDGDVPSVREIKRMQDAGFFPPETIAWFEALPHYYEDEHAIYVHAGLTEREPGRFAHPSELANKTPLLWVRTLKFFTEYRGKQVVCGHTTTQHLPPELSSWTPDDPFDMWVGERVKVIDTGCGKGGF